ncbi:SGNH/GDSL hydrolase family protein [Kitasatospora nipponensis]|uniref:SGNH/GDSL hydrolase family protein n=1 Tax=Kitasatospora nipponensis TaxID=258049 RepID=A0ABP4GU90_9ACTN
MDQTTRTPARFGSYVAVGDSFTEGMCDELLPDGQFRGWADRLAAALARRAAGTAAAAFAPADFRYANLAVRGKLIGQICAEQLAPAVALGGELVTLAGGLNDVLRPGCVIEDVEAQLGAAVERLLATGATVVLFSSTDPTRRMAGSARLLPAIHRLRAFVERLGEHPRVVVVDLFPVGCFDDRRLWAEDRLHLSPEGHRRVAEAVLQALGRPASFDWRAELPPLAAPGRWAAARADLRWLRLHVGPWLVRRITGRSSGDGRAPKRAELLPYRG